MRSWSSSSLALLLALAPAPALAQGSPQPVGVSDADALANTMRRLGSNPLDLDALLTAGELSIRLDDLSAAGAFFARAEKIDPRSPRAKAGEGAILVRSQRPAEAMRYFAAAEQYGMRPERFAGDRGLAYDLLGDQGRAQRDYKLALRERPDAETRRRYALSLAIAGRQGQALDEIAPLVKQNDRAAWRTRAFVLAMGGDATEASRIAQTMMPPGAALGLRSFFLELPRLSVIDRAFAVHFGETRPSAARLADARLAPRQAPLALDPAPVRVAAVTPPAPAQGGKKKRDRRKRDEVQVAALVAAPPPQPQPQPPAYQAPAYQPYAATTAVRDRPLTPGEQASLAAAGVRNLPRVASPSTSARGLTSTERASLAAATRPAPARPLPPVTLAAVSPATTARAPAVASTVAPAPITPPASSRRREVVTAAPVAVAQAPQPASSALLADAGIRPQLTLDLPPFVQPATVAATPAPGFSSSLTEPSATPASPPPTQLASLGAPASTAAPPGAVPVGTVQTAAPSALAATPLPSTAVASADVAPAAPVPAPVPVVASGVATSTPLAPLVTPPAAPVAVARPAPRRRMGRGEADSILAKIVANLSIPASELGVSGPARATPGAATPTAAERRKAAADKLVADRKAAADKKALADKRLAADKKALAAREATAEKKAMRGEPPRIWVQVAGGANEGDLAKAWRAARTKAPAALAARQGWTTPLRATNRVLTGPFKTEAEARAHVNQLARAGVSAFTFTSEAGQKITRLAAR